MKTIENKLLQWYDQNARILPWRGERDPYRIWLSEIMLQQTRAEAVIRYYERFLSAFPDVFALANAEQDHVLKLWEGLGYYSRARNLHSAAKEIAAAGGRFPAEAAGLEKLPGIGAYTARAIASIAYNECVPALDGNQMRVLSRVFGVERVLKTPFDLLGEAQSCMSKSRPGDYNQALMDLGSRVCKAKNPSCDMCPLQNDCTAYQCDAVERYPMKAPPVPKRIEERTVLLILHNGGICVRQRPSKGLLAALWEFPSAEGHIDPSRAKEELSPFHIIDTPERLADAKHVFTHIIWQMQGWAFNSDVLPDGCVAADLDFLHSHAFPSALRVYYEIAEGILAGIENN